MATTALKKFQETEVSRENPIINDERFQHRDVAVCRLIYQRTRKELTAKLSMTEKDLPQLPANLAMHEGADPAEVPMGRTGEMSSATKARIGNNLNKLRAVVKGSSQVMKMRAVVRSFQQLQAGNGSLADIQALFDFAKKGDDLWGEMNGTLRSMYPGDVDFQQQFMRDLKGKCNELTDMLPKKASSNVMPVWSGKIHTNHTESSNVSSRPDSGSAPKHRGTIKRGSMIHVQNHLGNETITDGRRASVKNDPDRKTHRGDSGTRRRGSRADDMWDHMEVDGGWTLGGDTVFGAGAGTNFGAGAGRRDMEREPVSSGKRGSLSSPSPMRQVSPKGRRPSDGTSVAFFQGKVTRESGLTGPSLASVSGQTPPRKDRMGTRPNSPFSACSVSTTEVIPCDPEENEPEEKEPEDKGPKEKELLNEAHEEDNELGARREGDSASTDKQIRFDAAPDNSMAALGEDLQLADSSNGSPTGIFADQQWASSRPAVQSLDSKAKASKRSSKFAQWGLHGSAGSSAPKPTRKPSKTRRSPQSRRMCDTDLANMCHWSAGARQYVNIRYPKSSELDGHADCRLPDVGEDVLGHHQAPVACDSDDRLEQLDVPRSCAHRSSHSLTLRQPPRTHEEDMGSACAELVENRSLRPRPHQEAANVEGPVQFDRHHRSGMPRPSSSVMSRGSPSHSSVDKRSNRCGKAWGSRTNASRSGKIADWLGRGGDWRGKSGDGSGNTGDWPSNVRRGFPLSPALDIEDIEDDFYDQCVYIANSAGAPDGLPTPLVTPMHSVSAASLSSFVEVQTPKKCPGLPAPERSPGLPAPIEWSRPFSAVQGKRPPVVDVRNSSGLQVSLSSPVLESHMLEMRRPVTR